MITGILIVISLIVTGVLIYKALNVELPNDYHERSQVKETAQKNIIKAVLIGAALIVISLFQPYSVERIDAGHKGIVVNLSGSERGVSSYQYKTGWVIYNTWFTQVLEFPTYQQHIEYDDQMVITKGGFSATIRPSFNYSLKEDAIGDMFQNLRLGVKEIEQGWLKNAIIGAVNDVSNTWEVDSIFGHRQQFENAIVAECNLRLTKWFNVSQLRTNITPPESLQDAIVAKTKSIQQAEAEEQRAIAAEAVGRRKVAEAKADSAEMIINASASARAIQLKQEKLTPMYIEYIKWNNASKDLPRVPTTVAGNGAGVFLNIK
jgi:regulator of protease activity HflC (stomatin/prohibitin superfamily)